MELPRILLVKAVKNFEYKIGNRCPVEWVVDQYKEWYDENDELYVCSLIKKLVNVSLMSLDVIEKINFFKLN
ncbi:MAG: hypothetical protein OEV44_12580 [Spirochaetota bacterium]|nr:hypothetical protein [Spirochaetota bacterium]